MTVPGLFASAIGQLPAAAKIAKHNAAYLATKGYDFGYMSPGTIRKVPDGWEVCVP